MSVMSQDEIERLIHCPKVVTEPPRREPATERGNSRNGARLKAKDGDEEFSMFVRINDSFNENFSIGLVFHPRDGRPDIQLLRCNGPHGPHVENYDDPITHNEYHVHLATTQAMEAGEAPERHAEVNKQHASYEEALRYFLFEINLVDPDRYFPGASQLLLIAGDR